MDTLIVSQSIFYIVSSAAILALGVLLSIAVYRFLQILKNTRDVSKDLSENYKKAKYGIKKIISLISAKK